MKIFLTGATGFVGKCVTQRLMRDGHKLLILAQEKDRRLSLKPLPGVNFIYGDLSDLPRWKNKLKAFKPEVAVHMAWSNIRDTGFEWSVKNLEESLSLIGFLNKIGCRLIVGAGTQWEYGHDKTGKIKENASREPYNSLAAAKIGIELLGTKLALEANTRFIWLRLFTIYGPGQRPGALIPSVINSFKKGEAAEIKSGNAKHDFIYVEDVADAIAMVIKKCRVQTAIFNVGSDKLDGVLKIAKLISKEFPGSRINLANEKTAKGKQHIVTGLYADIGAIKKATGWRPKTSIAAGVKKTVSYFKNI